jgi:hypothetical protein
MQTKTGGCHCGQVKFEITHPFDEVIECDCSMCKKKGFLHLIVDKENFKLIADESSLSDYQFNTKTAHHLFCKTCGICSYYIPRSHPDGFSVNARCVDDLDLSKVKRTKFEGSNWEENIEKIKS